MLLVTSTAQALQRARPVQVNGREYTIAEYVGAAPRRGIYVDGNEANDNGLPQGFLVAQPAGAITPPHFHEPNQFQVFVEGSGRIGAFPATPLTVQYANGHTPYGPIVAFDDGIRYFTLRQRWDPGAKYVPASRDKLIKGNQRTRVRGALATSSEAERRQRPELAVETIFATEADGLGAWLYRAGPQQEIVTSDPRDSGGQYLLVAAGGMTHDGAELPRLSTIFVSPEESPVLLATGESGLDLLILQFPRLATPRPNHDARKSQP